MAESLFDKYEKQAFRAGIQSRSAESREWFMDKLKTLKNINRRSLLKDPNVEKVTKPRVGSMYMYFYDPKLRETLPYYDSFPLTIMVGPAPGGFYGLNMHYVAPAYRARLLDGLLETLNNKKYDETTRMKISYNLLQSSAKFKYFKPCFKHYLSKHVETPMVRVEPPEWEIAVFLPSEQFQKRNKRSIWKDSYQIAKG